MDKNHSIRIRVGLEEEAATIATVSDLWKGAAYPERELFDMFGFNVLGHPNLSRLIMPDEWEGNPLRKDYPLITEEVTFSHNREFKQDLVKSKPPTR
jgi:NADH-quinone oxidoreductase subunit C